MNIKYIAELDGLRGISIILVLLSHAWLGHFVPGGLGVTIFFFISGYIITSLLMREREVCGDINIKKFYLRRFFRLMPALLVYLFVSVLVKLAYGLHVSLSELMSALFFYANYYGIFFGFSNEGLISPFTIVWSLSVEEHFYLVFPLLSAVLFGRARYFLVILLASIIFALAWRIYLVYGVGFDNLNHYRIYKSTDTRFDSIVFGVLFAVLSRHDRCFSFLSTNFSLIVGSSLILLSLLIRDDSFRETVRYSIQGVGLLFVFQHLIFGSPFLKSLLRLRLLVFFGKISYSLYLYHWLVFVMIEHALSSESLALRFFVMISFSILFAMTSRYFVERPGLNFGAKFGVLVSK